jgi:cytochrome c553
MNLRYSLFTPSKRFALRFAIAAAVCVACHTSFAAADATSPGKAIAMQGNASGAAACISCHGANGEGIAAAGFPRLAGLSAAYLSEQLAAFAAGKRQNAVMEPVAKALSRDDSEAVAVYFSGLPAPAGLPAADRKDIAPADTGAWLATRGRWDVEVPACAQCHGPAGVGVPPTFPPLAGQPAAYLAGQLLAWKKGLRPPGPMGLMPAIAGRLSDTDITAVATYYAGETAVHGGAGAASNAATSPAETRVTPATMTATGSGQ